MFELIWDLARGPKWLRVAQVLLLLCVAVAVLVWVIYPAIYDARVDSISI